MIQPQVLETINHWMKERDAVRIKKEAGAPKPWTGDPILQSYRFCNVRREDDKVTKWFAANWRNARHWEEEYFVPAMILGRTINWPETLRELDPYIWYGDLKNIKRQMDERQATGAKVYTGAYMITAGAPGVSKNEFVISNAATYFDKPPLAKRGTYTLESAWLELQQFPCVGPFIAGQIVADLKQTDVLSGAEDWYEWAPVGPGSMRGLNRLHGRPVKTQITQEQGLTEMRQLYLHPFFAHIYSPSRLCLQDVQNVLCEVDKYLRVFHGEGKPRASYPGR